MRNIARWLGYGAAFVLLSAYGCSAVGDRQTSDNEAATPSLVSTPNETVQAAPESRIAPWRTDPSIVPEQRHKIMRERYAKRAAAHPYAKVDGIVVDPQGAPMKGVKIAAAPMGQLEATSRTVTDEHGQFVMDTVTPGPVVLSFEHDKFVFKQEILTLQPSGQEHVRTLLMPRHPVQHFNANAGAVIKEGFVTVKFAPNLLVYENNGQPVDGDVEAIVTPIDPRHAADIEAAPARLEGISADGRPSSLMSYGMVEVELFKDGKKLNVRRGETAEMEFEIDGMLNTNELSEIPMWHHDHKSGYWVQEKGVQAKISANEAGHTIATTKVPHFSSWNVDNISDSICTTMLLRRVMTTSPPTNFLPQSLQVWGTSSTGTGQNWTIKPHRTVYPGGAARFTFNAPSGKYGKGQYYQVKAQNNVTAADPNPPMQPLLVRYPTTESTVVVAKNINDYIIQKTGMSDSTGGATAGNWCGPLPSGWQWGVAKYFTSLDWNAPGYDAIQYFTGGAVSGKTMSQWRMRFTYALRPTGTSFVEGAAQNAQNIVNANPIFGDSDNDGVVDNDTCPGWPNHFQNDSDGNGIGDACESYCVVPANSLNAQWYDSDGDEVDDWCDNNPWEADPTQLTNIIYDF